jgi:hypothetical protein
MKRLFSSVLSGYQNTIYNIRKVFKGLILVLKGSGRKSWLRTSKQEEDIGFVK